MRHGHDAISDDGERHLSAIGEDQAAVMGERLQDMFPDGLDEVHVSPILRAQETAQIVTGGVAVKRSSTDERLAAGVGTEEYNRLIGDAMRRSVNSVLLIGHLPEVVACALEQCGESYEENANLTIGQGTAIRLEVAKGTQPNIGTLEVVSGMSGSRALID